MRTTPGASVVHIHGREPESGAPTWSVDIYRRIRDEVQCPLADPDQLLHRRIQHGVEGDAEKRERLSYVPATRPELAALNMGSMNYAKYSADAEGVRLRPASSPTRSGTSSSRSRRCGRAG